MNPSILDSLAWAMVKAVAIVIFAFGTLMYLAWLGTKGSSSKHKSRLAVGRIRRGAAMLLRTAINFSPKNNDRSVPMPALQRGPSEPNI